MTGRFHGIDALRGLALVNMVLYHLLYDINTVYGLQAQWINTPFRTLLATMHLLELHPHCRLFLGMGAQAQPSPRLETHPLRHSHQPPLRHPPTKPCHLVRHFKLPRCSHPLAHRPRPPHQSPVAPCRRHIGTGTALSPERHSTWHHRPRLGFTKRPLYHLPRCAPWASAGIFYLHRLLPNSLVVPSIFMRYLPLPSLFAMPRLPTQRPHPYPRFLRSRTPLHRCLPHPSAHPAIHLLPLHGPAGLTVEGV